MDDQVLGIFHVHDSRTCWDCGGLGLVNGAISIKVVEGVLQRLGWRFLEPGGRMVCSDCAWDRRHWLSNNR